VLFVLLKEWIEKEFGERGIAAAARFLGYPYKTVIAWVNFQRFPRPETQEIIALKSGGLVDVNQCRTAYLAATHKRKGKKR
jgi:hypothetical protein